tara:strand:- start:105 stop:725 length:621 start_codon:yes stop_codon:yes gene_type:complete
MIQQLPLAILEEHIIPQIKEYIIPNVRESCEILCDLTGRRFAKMMVKKYADQEKFINKCLNNLDRFKHSEFVWKGRAQFWERETKRNSKLLDASYNNLQTVRFQIKKMDTIIQNYRYIHKINPNNTTKPKFLGYRNGPVENFKQWLIHENGESPSLLNMKSSPRLKELKTVHSFSKKYNTTVPWFRYIELHMDFTHSKRYIRDGKL